METATTTLLPKEKTKPERRASKQPILLYGAPKIGKTTFASKAPGTLFLATEGGLNYVEAYSIPIPSYDVFLRAMKEVMENGHGYQTLVIDTVDNLYRLCTEWVCAQHKVKYVGDLEYGKGYSLVNGEFLRVLTRIVTLGYGLILISHSRAMEVKSRGGSITKIVPTLPERAREIVIGLVDHVLYADFEEEVGVDQKVTSRRVIRTAAGPEWEAGSRFPGLPEQLDLEWSAFEKALSTNGKEAKHAGK